MRPERRRRVIQPDSGVNHDDGRNPLEKARHLRFLKGRVEAWKQVKANQGAAGVDSSLIADFEKKPQEQSLQNLESHVIGQLHARRSEQYRYRKRQAASACSGPFCFRQSGPNCVEALFRADSGAVFS